MSKTYQDAYAAGLHAGMSKEMAEAFARSKAAQSDRIDVLNSTPVEIVQPTVGLAEFQDIEYEDDKRLDNQSINLGYDREYEVEKRLDDRDRARECNRVRHVD